MSIEMQQTRFNSIERRPRTLKDFLSENHLSSCSSSGFKSLPRIKPNDAHKISSMHNLIEMDLKSRKNPPNSAFQTLIKTIRSILVKKSATMILPRSITRKLSSTSSSRSRRIIRNQAFCKGGSEIEVSTVKIKDILRWKSFRDINVEEHKNQSQPLDLPPQSPPLDFHRCMVGSTTTTTTTTTTTCSSNGSSWSDSDFASGYLSSWEAQNDDVEGSEKFSLSLSPPVLVGKDLMEPRTKTAKAKGFSSFEEDEQHSPVSVLQVGEDEFSTFDQCLSNIERRKQKFIQSVQGLEGVAKFDRCFLLDENSNYDDEEVLEEQDHVEERARQLLHSVKAAGSLQSCKDYDLDVLLLDFFREELIGRREQTWNDDEEYEFEILRIAKDWLIGSRACDIGHVNKDACIKDMDRRGEWSRFAEKEKQEFALQIEMAIMHSLVDEVLDLDG